LLNGNVGNDTFQFRNNALVAAVRGGGGQDTISFADASKHARPDRHAQRR